MSSSQKRKPPWWVIGLMILVVGCAVLWNRSSRSSQEWSPVDGLPEVVGEFDSGVLRLPQTEPASEEVTDEARAESPTPAERALALEILGVREAERARRAARFAAPHVRIDAPAVPERTVAPVVVKSAEEEVALDAVELVVLPPGRFIQVVLAQAVDTSEQSFAVFRVAQPVTALTESGALVEALAPGTRIGCSLRTGNVVSQRLGADCEWLFMGGEQVELAGVLTGEMGAGGVEADVDRHWSSRVANAGVLGLLAAGSNLVLPDDGSPELSVEDATRLGVGERFSDVAARDAERFLNVPPTISVEAGRTATIQLMSSWKFPIS